MEELPEHITVKAVDANLANVGITMKVEQSIVVGLTYTLGVIDSRRPEFFVAWFSFMINLCCLFVGKICKIILF